MPNSTSRTVFGPVTKDQAKDTGMVMAFILLVIAFITKQYEGYAVAAAAVLLVDMVVPAVFKLPGRLWFGLSMLLSEFMSRIILSLVFFLVITPIGLVRRGMGKDSLKLKKFRKDEDSVFVVRDHEYVPRDIETPY